MAALNICMTIINLLTFSALGVKSIDLTSDVDIRCSEDDTCVKKYNLYRYPRTLVYEGSENINGTLHHGITFASNGKCFTPKFVFRGISDLIWAGWELEELDTSTPVKKLTTGEQMNEFFVQKGTPTFSRKNPGTLSLCQSIAASRELKYKPCGGLSECLAGVDNQEKGTHCRRYYQGTSIFPVTTWLNKKADDGNYPSIQIANGTHISIDWGKAKDFKCGEDIINVKTNNKVAPVSGNFTVSFKDPQNKIKELTISHDHFKFENDYIEIKKFTALEEPACYTFTVEIKVTLRFTALKKGATQYRIPLYTEILPRSTEKLSTKIWKSISSNGPNGKNDLEDNSKIETVNKTQTYLLIQHEDKKAPINCLQKKVTVKNMNTNKREKVDIIEKRKVDLTSFIVVPCEETKIKIRARNTANEVVIEKYFTFLPTVNADNTNTDTEDGAGHLIVNEANFENCPNLKFEVVCDTFNEASDKNITNREILGYNNITKKSDEFKMEGRCKARAFLCEGTNETCSDKEVKSEWTYFYGEPIPKVDKLTMIASITGSIAAALVISGCAIFFLRYKEKRIRQERKETIVKKVRIKVISSPTPDHFVFNKDENLGETLKDITGLQDIVIEEFVRLEKFDANTINCKETTKVATKEPNLRRNRYKDILPYDSNLVLLKTKTGDPPSGYINASMIKFCTLDQKFLAVQAPRPNMYSAFWQLAREEDVHIIVMISKLIEDGKRKAHKYWPDKSQAVIIFENGIKVELLSEDKKSHSFHHRQFKLTYPKNRSRLIHHLQCVNWENKMCLTDTRILHDLAKMTNLLAADNPGPIMVHCSAGVGRTGAFIAFYKMAQDLENDQVDRIDPFETVLEMRRARTKMVQKPFQYHYVFKCLSDLVNGRMSVYSYPDEETNNDLENTSLQNEISNADLGTASGTSQPPIQTGGGLDITGSQMAAGRDILIQGPTNTFNTSTVNTSNTFNTINTFNDNRNLVVLNIDNNTNPDIVSEIVRSVSSTNVSSVQNEALGMQSLT